MDTKKTCWRALPLDVKPVEVLRRPGAAVDDAGRLRAGYYETEMQAWGGILSGQEEAVNVAVGRHQQALAEVAAANRGLIERRLNYSQVVDAYDVFRRAYAKRMGTAV